MLRRILLLMFSFALASCKGVVESRKESKLYGTWRSDSNATIEYLTEFAKLTKLQEKALFSLFGHTTIVFSRDGTGYLETAAWVMENADGEDVEIPEGTVSFTFEILGESDSQIVLRTTSEDGMFEDSPFAVLKFEEPDTYSVSLSDGISSINGREFFKRSKSQENEQGAAANP